MGETPAVRQAPRRNSFLKSYKIGSNLLTPVRSPSFTCSPRLFKDCHHSCAIGNNYCLCFWKPQGTEMAKYFESLLRSDPLFEIPAKRHLGLVVFRLKVTIFLSYFTITYTILSWWASSLRIGLQSPSFSSSMLVGNDGHWIPAHQNGVQLRVGFCAWKLRGISTDKNGLKSGQLDGHTRLEVETGRNLTSLVNYGQTQWNIYSNCKLEMG